MTENSFVWTYNSEQLGVNGIERVLQTTGSINAQFIYQISTYANLLAGVKLSNPLCINGLCSGSQLDGVLLHNLRLNRTVDASCSLAGTIIALRCNTSIPSTLYEFGRSGLAEYASCKIISEKMQEIFKVQLSKKEVSTINHHGLKILLSIAGFHGVVHHIEELFKTIMYVNAHPLHTSNKDKLRLYSPLVKVHNPLPLLEGVLAARKFEKKGDLYIKEQSVLEEISVFEKSAMRKL